MACDVTGKPCRVGSIVCTTGAPVCTETDNKPNGTACGTGMVCQDGTCATCQAGGACTPTEQVPQRDAGLLGRGAGVHGHQHQRRRRDVVRDGHGLRRPRRLRRVRRRAATAPCPASRAARAPSPATPARPSASSRATRPTAPSAARTWSARRRLRGVLGGVDLRAREPVSRRHHRLLAEHRLHRHGQRARERRRLRHRQGLQRGHLRVVRGGLELPADQRLQDRARRRARPARRSASSRGTARTARPAAPTWCATPAAAATCTERRRLHAHREPVPHRDADLHAPARRPAADSGANQPDGTGLRDEPGVQSRQLPLVHGEPAVSADQPVQDRRDVVHDRRVVCTETGNKGAGTLCGAGQSCTNGVLTWPRCAPRTARACRRRCSARADCNTAGTDCATCPTGQTSCPAGCRDPTRDVTTAGGAAPCARRPAPNTGIPVCVDSTCVFRATPATSNARRRPRHVPAQELGLRGHGGGGVQGAQQPVRRPDGCRTRPARCTAASTRWPAPSRRTPRRRGFQVGLPLCGAAGRSQGKSLVLTAWMILEPTAARRPTLGKRRRTGAPAW